MKEALSLKLKHFLQKYSISCILVLVTIILCLLDTTLLSIRNMRNIISDAAPIFLMATGMALCMYSGFIDLSAGALASFAGIIAGSFVQRSDAAGRIIPFLPPIPAFVVIPLIVALFYSLGRFYVRFLYKNKIPSWFFTLAISSILMGLSYIFVSTSDIGNMQISGFTNQFLQFGVGYIGTGPTYSVPLTILIVIATLTLLMMYLKRHNLQLKNNTVDMQERNTKANLNIIFGCSTALFALAGIMVTARNAAAVPAIGFGLTSEAIAICLMAKFSIKGGTGNIRSIIIVSIVYAALIYCVTYVGVSQYISLVLRGIIIVFSLTLDTRKIHRKEESINIHNSENSI